MVAICYILGGDRLSNSEEQDRVFIRDESPIGSRAFAAQSTCSR